MNLADILSIQTIRAPLQSSEKKGAIRELVDALVGANQAPDADALFEAVWSREQVRTTGIGHGLAIPHGKCANLPRLAMAVGKPAVPMEFGSIDQKPVRLIVLLASPVDRTADHIQALAKISKLMMSEEARNRVYTASAPEEILAIFQQAEAAPAA